MLAAALGDQAAMWITINEPLQTVHQGYRIGTHAPGHRDPSWPRPPLHHILLGHGYALQALRAQLPRRRSIGPTMDPQPFMRSTRTPLPAAEALDAEYNRAYLDPVLRGAYPVDLRAICGRRMR